MPKDEQRSDTGFLNEKLIFLLNQIKNVSLEIKMKSDFSAIE